MWIKPNDYVALNSLSPTGSSKIHQFCLTGRGGGVAVIYNDNTAYKHLEIISMLL